MATWIRSLLEEPGRDSAARVGAAAEGLEALARELGDAELSLDPACAVACERILSDSSTSPLLNSALPADDTRVRLLQIRAGFEQRGLSRREVR